MLGAGVAFGGYGNPPPLNTTSYGGASQAAAPTQPAAVPGVLETVRHVKLTSKAIVVTFNAPEQKNHKRSLVIDYSELVPGTTSAKATTGGVAGATGGRSPLVYLIGGLVGLNLLGRARRMVRRVVK